MYIDKDNEITAGSIAKLIREKTGVKVLTKKDAHDILAHFHVPACRYVTTDNGKEMKLYGKPRIFDFLDNPRNIAWIKNNYGNGSDDDDEPSTPKHHYGSPVENYYSSPEMKKASEELLKKDGVYGRIKFDDDKDTELYEQMFGRKIYFNQEQIQFIKESYKKKNKKIFFTENQLNHIKEILLSESSVNPSKVLLVKKYLDNNFVRASMPTIGSDGYPNALLIVGMKGVDGEVARNLTAKQLFYLLQDKFSGIYGDKKQRDSFLKQVMKDWYNKKISKQGLLSTNKF